MQASQARTVAPEYDEVLVTRLAPLVPAIAEGPALEHLHVVPPALERPTAADAVKRGLDLVLALAALVVLAPLLAVIALAIRLDTAGPVLYRQRRVGRGGDTFDMFKFRTMVDGAHERRYELVHLNEAADGLFKITHDPRVTRVGRLLRRTHTDELPQLLHVLAGRMSIVGPRPLVPEEDELVPAHLRDRLRVRPGMTGPWQVTGRHDLGLASMAQLDLDYIEGWTPWRDLDVIARTAWHVVALRGK